MADNKGPQLSDASIPPPTAAEEQPRHHRGRKCCCCLSVCLWWTLVVLIILVLLIILLFYLIVQPRAFKFYVSDASLTEFNYTRDTNTLHYNLVLNFTARNPNKKLSIYYDEAVGHTLYEGLKLGNDDVITYFNSFRSDKKQTDRMSGVFKDGRVLVFDEDQMNEFEEDKRNGVFDIGVRLNFRIRLGRNGIYFGSYRPKVTCGLSVPLRNSNGTSVAKFEPTQCDVNF